MPRSRAASGASTGTETAAMATKAWIAAVTARVK